MWIQIKEIVKFTGPATGLWICGPLMSLIDTAVIGQGSSIELAALGPGTVICDYMSYVFMFLSIATSNMVATSLARKLLQGQTMHMLYLQQTPMFSLGMKDSWGPLKALVVASVVNAVGDIVLCSFLGYGIAGAAWATMASQVVAGFMMIEALNKKGYNAFSISIPSPHELLTVLGLAAPVFITLISKVAFYSLLTYVATSLGTHTMAVHQVLVQTFVICTVWGEPLSQTAVIYARVNIWSPSKFGKGSNLLKSLVVIGATLGLLLGIVGTSVPWLFPKIFTHDQNIIQEMHKVLIPYFLELAVTPPTHTLEGTLLAGRDLKFLSLSMSGCFSAGAFLLLVEI